MTSSHVVRLSDCAAALKAVLEESDSFSMFLGNYPVPASRPRVTRWGTTYSKTYNQWRKDVVQYVRNFGTTVDSALIVLVEIYRVKPRTSQKDWPPGDVDNYAKGPMDAVTRYSDIWNDDDQVTGLWVSKQWADEAGMLITIFDIGD